MRVPGRGKELSTVGEKRRGQDGSEVKLVAIKGEMGARSHSNFGEKVSYWGRWVLGDHQRKASNRRGGRQSS